MRVAAWLWAWGTLCLATFARAQDMQFALSEVAPAAPAAEAAPSQTLTAALGAYEREQYAEAALQLQRVIEGQTDDAPAQLQRAQFVLGKALYHLGFLHSSLTLFDEIGEYGSEHAYFEHSLPWLAELARVLPDGADVARLLARYPPGLLDAPAALAATPEARDRLRYLRGRAAYDDGELQRAIALLSEVSRDSPLYLQARFLIGVSHVRARRARPAVSAFRAILAATEDGDEGAPRRMRDLAWLSLGRVYYTAAHGTRDRAAQAALFGNAVDAYNRIEPDSEHWLDALFESSWALFVTDEYSRALGNIHALLSPFFDANQYPEALVVKAVVFFDSCQTRNAQAVVQQFHERFDDSAAALAVLLSERDDGALLSRLRATGDGDGDGNKDATARPLARALAAAMRDRALAGELALLDRLARERAALSRMPAAFARASLGARILQDLAVGEQVTTERAATRLRARIERSHRELQELANQIDTIEIELIRYQRDKLSRPPGPPTHRAGREVIVDSEHMLWPFDGEYWRDELGYYRQRVSDACER